MKAASVKDIGSALEHQPVSELVQICQRLARFKKENKELLTYLLFEASDEEEYIRGVKAEIDEAFSQINTTSLYFAKKNLRKIIRIVLRHVRYSGKTATEAELHLHVARCLRASGIPFEQHPVMKNMYQSQLHKVEQAMAKLHEDLQYDLQKQLNALYLEKP